MGCTGCIGCTSCMSCTGCTSCIGCNGCIGCTSCIGCNGCTTSTTIATEMPYDTPYMCLLPISSFMIYHIVIVFGLYRGFNIVITITQYAYINTLNNIKIENLVLHNEVFCVQKLI